MSSDEEISKMIIEQVFKNIYKEIFNTEPTKPELLKLEYLVSTCGECKISISHIFYGCAMSYQLKICTFKCEKCGMVKLLVYHPSDGKFVITEIKPELEKVK